MVVALKLPLENTVSIACVVRSSAPTTMSPWLFTQPTYVCARAGVMHRPRVGKQHQPRRA
jgi:hypothetical protein